MTGRLLLDTLRFERSPIHPLAFGNHDLFVKDSPLAAIIMILAGAVVYDAFSGAVGGGCALAVRAAGRFGRTNRRDAPDEQTATFPSRDPMIARGEAGP